MSGVYIALARNKKFTVTIDENLMGRRKWCFVFFFCGVFSQEFVKFYFLQRHCTWLAYLKPSGVTILNNFWCRM